MLGIDLAQRAEQAGLNASAPPQEKLIEGWLIRLSPGKAKRSRCINALAAGSLPLDELLARCQAAFAAANLPLYVRVTPYSQPADLDERLAAKGWPASDAADVMVLAALPSTAELPAGQILHTLDAPGYAQLVGHLRGSSAAEISAHAERMQASPVPYQGFALWAGGALLACGQFAREGGIVGLFDIFTPPEQRGQGHAFNLCRRLLHIAGTEGAREAYLQVGSDNPVAQRVYARLGFSFAYRYHYRSPATATATANTAA
ncbi:GNAT family N-acetyltransferase [Roseateles oligotrophus]|uniref:GNAT family N-acetyltransferase n=1 Tax=Roseateles oligotrophus TaxID=1769250 RepID=A0ABT2YM21_9BURK|nr:GNAT family N-acetyltransferase [Roseateles oligotrophus]MCV2371111.1 GNAT family N-acetyltransferase [Roseateles oligotrophus]